MRVAYFEQNSDCHINILYVTHNYDPQLNGCGIVPQMR